MQLLYKVGWGQLFGNLQTQRFCEKYGIATRLFELKEDGDDW